MGNDSSAPPPDQGNLAAAAQIPRMSIMNIVVDVVRHALPLVPLYFFNGSLLGYMLLTTFDLSMGLVLIFNTTRGPVDVTARGRVEMTKVDPRSRWLISRVVAVLVGAAIFAVEAAMVSVPIVVPAFVFGMVTGVDASMVTSQLDFRILVAAMSLIAAARFQGWFESGTTPGGRGAPAREGLSIDECVQDRKRSLAANAAQVTLIATFMVLCYLLITFGRSGLYALPFLYSALLVFYDVRPDIAQRIFPALWRKT
jgi:hypothetical protein